MTRAARCWARFLFATACLCFGLSTTVRGQERTITVLVEHIAGANLYLDEGTEQGITEGDTLTVFREREGEPVGHFVVVTASATRSVVTFLATPFAVTRGQEIQIRIASNAVMTPAEAIPLRATARGPRYRSTGPIVRGRISMAFDGNRSSTLPLSPGGIPVERSFVTPSVRMRTSIGRLPGDMQFRTNLRLSSRYTLDTPVAPSRSARIYQASISRTVGNVQFEAGRFYNPYEDYSGYWDGALLRLGNKRIGIGAVVGFEPNRGNELFNSQITKYSVFADYEYSAGNFNYRTDVSVHRADPQPGLSEHMYMGWSQSLGIGRFRFTQRTQLDRDPETNKLIFTNIQARISTPVTRTMSLRARYVYRRPYFMFRTVDVISYRREEASVGVSFSGPEGNINVDVGADRIEAGELSWSYATSFNLGQTVIPGLSLSGAARYWTRQGLTGFYASPGIAFTSSVIRWVADYRFYATDLVNGQLMTHGATFGITVPLGRSSYTNARVGMQRGDLTSNITFGGGVSISF